MIIRREKEDNPYARLQAQALDRLQALSGNRWTDFNAHDPGITLLEALHYALLELQSSMELPFETYLSEKDKMDYTQFGLFPVSEITAPTIATPSDYKNLFKEEISEIKHCRITISDDYKYDILVESEENADEAKIKTHITELYHAHRNLCETLGEITFVKIDAGMEEEHKKHPMPEFDKKNGHNESNNLFSINYYSFQNHFPDTYGVNEKGIPAGTSPQRKIQIKQLKAYLSIFDYLMENTLHQTGTIRQLLELSNNIPPPYQSAFPAESQNKLVDKQRFEHSQIFDSHFWHLQKSYLLDQLDMMYGEDTRTLFSEIPDLCKQNEKRAQFIRLSPRLDAERFRSFNILKDEDPLGIEQWAFKVFGYVPCVVEHILLEEHTDDYNCLTLVMPTKLFPADKRKQSESLIRERLPAHLDIRFLWMETDKMKHFERNYLIWKEAMRQQNRENTVRYSRIMREIIEKMKRETI
jgi:hypothetical protein